MISMIANRAMTYRTRRLMAGDPFDAREVAARLLLRRGKARLAEQAHPPQRPPMEGDDLEVLRALAKAKGIKVDGRWSVKRLKSEIAQR